MVNAKTSPNVRVCINGRDNEWCVWDVVGVPRDTVEKKKKQNGKGKISISSEFPLW